MLARILNENLQMSIPKAGVLKDGRSVSNYHLLPIDVLKEEGWKEVVKDRTNGMQWISRFYQDGDNIVVIYSDEEI